MTVINSDLLYNLLKLTTESFYKCTCFCMNCASVKFCLHPLQPSQQLIPCSTCTLFTNNAMCLQSAQDQAAPFTPRSSDVAPSSLARFWMLLRVGWRDVVLIMPASRHHGARQPLHVFRLSAKSSFSLAKMSVGEKFSNQKLSLNLHFCVQI